MLRFLGIVFSLLLMAVACDDAGLFDDLENAEQEVRFLEDFSTRFIGSNETLNLEIWGIFEADTPDSWVDLRLLDQDSLPLENISWDWTRISLDAALIQLELSANQIPSGIYTLQVEVYEEGESLIIRDFPLVLGEEPGNISVESYPQRIYPGSEVILQVQGDWDFLGGAVFTWSTDNRQEKSGTLAEGGDRFNWKTSEEPGYQNIVLEIFPQLPGDVVNTSASIRLGVQVATSTQENLDPLELGPEESYLSLLHFRGNFRDHGTLMNGTNHPADAFSSPEFDYRQGTVGYHFSPGTLLELPYLALPYRENIEPFSIQIRGLLDEPGTLVSWEKGDFFASLEYTPANELSFTWGDDEIEDTERVDLPPFPTDVENLTISFVPEEIGGSLFWYSGPDLIGTSQIETPNIPEDGEEKTILGGITSFVGLLDEFGVYFQDEQQRPGIDSAFFSRSLLETVSGELVYAQGFDALYLPEEMLTIGPTTLGSGALSLEPGSSLILPSLIPDQSRWTFYFPWPSERSPSQVIRFRRPGEEEPLLILQGDGTIQSPYQGPIQLDNTTDFYQFSLEFLLDHSYLLGSAENALLEALVGEPLEIELANTASATQSWELDGLFIEKIWITRQ